MSTLRASYGFSALFEAMGASTRRAEAEDTIMDFASGAMEASLLGDDIVSALGVSDEDIPTSMDDFEDIADDSDMDPSLRRLDAALDDSIDDEDDSDLDILDEALDLAVDADLYKEI